MPFRITWLIILTFAWATREISLASAQDGPASATWQDLQFDRPAPYSSDTEFRRRLGYTLKLPDYHIAKEKFRIFIPGTFTTNRTWGFSVWISPSDEPYIPASWEPELATRRLLVISAYRSGNGRSPIERCRLALDAGCNLSRLYQLDSRRLFVGGFSGGSRIASILGVGYADLFSGVLCVCGVDFYRPVPSATGGYYLGTYKPDASLLLRAMGLGRFVLLTGEKDLNRDNTKSTAENGFKAVGFKNCLYREVPAMSHAMPAANEFSSALDYLLIGK